MRTTLSGLGLVSAALLLVVACGGTGVATPSATPTAEPTATPTAEPTAEPTATPTAEPTAEPTATPAETASPTASPSPTIAAPVIELSEPNADGVVDVTINSAALAPLFDAFMSGSDPFYLIHTQQPDLFVSVELYTVYGSRWTGELGTFPAKCTSHGICVYLDPDGTGPLPGGGPGEGTITIVQLEGGSIVTIDDVRITASDGTVYRIRGLTLTG